MHCIPVLEMLSSVLLFLSVYLLASASLFASQARSGGRRNLLKLGKEGAEWLS